MRYVADLHLHSAYARATSKELNFENLVRWSRFKGIDLIENTEVIFIGVPTLPFGAPPISVVAFIDNITFHPVPEPSTLALLAVCLAALMIYRRRIV